MKRTPVVYLESHSHRDDDLARATGVISKYSDDQPRDDNGRWTDGSSSGGSSSGATSSSSESRVESPPLEHIPAPGRTSSVWSPMTASTLNIPGNFDGELKSVDTLSSNQIEDINEQLFAMVEDLHSRAHDMSSDSYDNARNALTFTRNALDPVRFDTRRAYRGAVALSKDGKIRGGALYKLSPSGDKAKIAFLGSLQRGAGGQLLEQIEREAASAGVSTIFLESTDFAEKFYESRGYTPMKGAEGYFEKRLRVTHALTLPDDEIDELDPIGVLCADREFLDEQDANDEPEEKRLLKYREDQERDEHGRWTDGGGSSSTSSSNSDSAILLPGAAASAAPGHTRSTWSPMTPSVLDIPGNFDGTIVPGEIMSKEELHEVGRQLDSMERKLNFGWIEYGPAYANARNALRYTRWGLEASQDSRTRGWDNVVALSRDGSIRGSAIFKVDPETKDAKLQWLGSLQRGAGRQMLAAVEEAAIAAGARSIRVESTTFAEKFYKAHGYKAGEGMLYKDLRSAKSTAPDDVIDELDPIGVLCATDEFLEACEPMRKAEEAKDAKEQKRLLKYREDQERDDHGRWSSEGGGGEYQTTDHQSASMPLNHDKMESYLSGSEKLASEYILQADPQGSYEQVNPDKASELKEHVEVSLAVALSGNKDWQAFKSVAAKGGDYTHGELTSNFISQWAQTSSDSSPASLAMQYAVQEEFGLKDARDPAANGSRKMGFDEACVGLIQGLSGAAGSKIPQADVDATKAGVRAFVREMYTQTQRSLDNAGIPALYLYRGHRDEVVQQEGLRTLKLQPMSSFSSSPLVALDFAKGERASLTVVRVPKERILSTPRTGYGCRMELECVVIGGGDLKGLVMDADSTNYRTVRDDVKERISKLPKSKKGAVVYIEKASTDEPLELDSTLENSDWTKFAWDLPPYKSDEFNALVSNIEQFKKLPIYKHAVENGLIVDDEWTRKSLSVKYREDQERDEHGRWTSEGGETGSGHEQEAAPASDSRIGASSSSSSSVDTNSHEFKGWFKQSKVVDDNGEPMPVYHKTDAEFDQFDESKIGQSDPGYAGRGFYFTPTALPGTIYGTKTVKAYLSLQNPYIRTKENWDKDPLNPYVWIPAHVEEFGSRAGASRAWTSMMESKGYDGFMDKTDPMGEIVAFRADQIRIVKERSSKKSGVVYIEKYSDDQPRDDHGRWTDGSGSSDSSSSQSSSHEDAGSNPHAGSSSIAGSVYGKREWEDVQADRARVGEPVDYKTFMSEVNSNISKTGALKVIDSFDLPREAREALHVTAEFHPTTKQHVEAVAGIAEKVKELTEEYPKIASMMSELDMKFVAVNSSNRGGRMAISTGEDGNFLAMNFNHDATEQITGLGFIRTYSGKAGNEAYKAGATIEEATRKVYAVSVSHEIGHILDQATDGAVTREFKRAVANGLRAENRRRGDFGPDQKISRRGYLANNISNYANFLDTEGAAEAVAIVLTGGKLPKSFDRFAGKVREVASGGTRKWLVVRLIEDDEEEEDEEWIVDLDRLKKPWTEPWYGEGEEDEKEKSLRAKYSDEQARDDHGRWTSEGGESGTGHAPEPKPTSEAHDDLRGHVSASAARESAPKASRASIDEARKHIDSVGMKYGTVSDAGPAAKASLNMKEPKLNEDHIRAIHAVADGYSKFAEEYPSFSKVIADAGGARFIPAEYEPHAASMTTITGDAGLRFLINTGFDPVGSLKDEEGAWTLSSAAAARHFKETKDADAAIDILYKGNIYHELGHAMDRASGGLLTQVLLGGVMKDSGGDMDKLQRWVEKHISGYGATKPKEATAEAFAMVMLGMKMPKGTELFTRLIKSKGAKKKAIFLTENDEVDLPLDPSRINEGEEWIEGEDDGDSFENYEKALQIVTRYSEDQPRDDHGRWTDGSGSSDGSSEGSASAGGTSGYGSVGGIRDSVEAAKPAGIGGYNAATQRLKDVGIKVGPAELVDEVVVWNIPDIEEPKQDDFKKGHIAALHGVADAKEQIAAEYPKLAALANDIPLYMISSMQFDSGMANYESNGKQGFLFNVAQDPEGMLDGPSEYSPVTRVTNAAREAGKPVADQIRAGYKAMMLHEYGHMMDNASGKKIQAAVKKVIRDEAGIAGISMSKWARENISTRGSHGLPEATAELFAAHALGLPVHDSLKPIVAKMDRSGGKKVPRKPRKSLVVKIDDEDDDVFELDPDLAQEPWLEDHRRREPWGDDDDEEKSLVAKYREDQERDDHGRWSDEGGSSSSEANPNAPSLPIERTDFLDDDQASRSEISPATRNMDAVDNIIAAAGREWKEDSPIAGDARAKAQSQLELHNVLKNDERWHEYLTARGLGPDASVHPEIVAGMSDEEKRTWFENDSKQEIRQLVDTWSQTANDSNVRSLALQMAAAEEFGLVGTRDARENGRFKDASFDLLCEKLTFNGSNPDTDLAQLHAERDTVKSGLKLFVRTTYERTQEILKANGIEDVYIARGSVRTRDPGWADIVSNPLSSWSVKPEVAYDFTGHTQEKNIGSVVITRVPRERVFSIPNTGIGCQRESEVVILGGKGLRGFIGTPEAFSTYGWEPKLRDQMVWVARQGKKKDLVVKAASEVFDVDETLEDSDWMKVAWDLPPYKSDDFLAAIGDTTLDEFRELPIYKHAVDAGLIVDDEWAKSGEKAKDLRLKYSEDQPRDDHGRWTDGSGASDAGGSSGGTGGASGGDQRVEGGYGGVSIDELSEVAQHMRTPADEKEKVAASDRLLRSGVTVIDRAGLPDVLRSRWQAKSPSFTRDDVHKVHGVAKAIEELKTQYPMYSAAVTEKAKLSVCALTSESNKNTGMLVAHQMGTAYVALNAGHADADYSHAVADQRMPNWTVAHQMAVENYRATGDIRRSVEIAYAHNMKHEVGHIIDNMSGGKLSDAFFNRVVLPGAKKAGVSPRQYLKKNLSIYGAGGSGNHDFIDVRESFAELFSAAVSGVRVHPDFEPFARYVRRLGRREYLANGVAPNLRRQGMRFVVVKLIDEDDFSDLDDIELDPDKMEDWEEAPFPMAPPKKEDEEKGLALVTRYREDQQRDEFGRWSDEGGNADAVGRWTEEGGNAGASGPQDIVQEWSIRPPTDFDNEINITHRESLTKLTQQDKATLADNGVQIVLMGNNSIADFDASLKGKTPRGWENTGYTWDSVGACYREATKQVLLGNTKLGGGINIALHETGHALNACLSGEECRAIDRSWQQNVAKSEGIVSYLRQTDVTHSGDNIMHAGAEESFAEAFSELRAGAIGIRGYGNANGAAARADWNKFKSDVERIIDKKQDARDGTA